MPLLSDASAKEIPEGPSDSRRFQGLLADVVAGETSALGELFCGYGDVVFRSAFRLTGNRADAEDATQEVFVRLAGAARGFTGSAAGFSSWIRRVAVRQALMHLRTSRRRREVDVDAVAALVAPRDSLLDRLTIGAALAQLSVEHRTVFLLKEVEGYDHTEIAELLGISPGSSQVRLHRARRQLREILRGSR
ncbi:MAG: sigma-70 family RNA polymerase sigma factor [Gemmatimonadota bacterium]|nr:sigma-70 family RNA polymerase sigma factor [Gemmatimonadota bacterium]